MRSQVPTGVRQPIQGSDHARLITQKSQVQILSPLRMSGLVRGGFRTIPEAASTALIGACGQFVGSSRRLVADRNGRSRWMNVDIAAPADRAAARVRTKRPVPFAHARA
jgi:hypothetical protein